jgi:hypothetical protein
MSIAKLTTSIHQALDAAFVYSEAIDEARKNDALKGKSYEEVRELILPLVASFPKYSVPLVDGQRKSAGKKVLDSTHAKYEAANKAAQRLAKDIVGKSKGQQEELEVPEHIQALADKLTAACKKYEEARRLASTAIASAFSK